jgi:hypothetical protein
MLKSMSLPSGRELVGRIRQRYKAAGRKDKGRILDEFVATAGLPFGNEGYIFCWEASNVFLFLS